MKREPHVSVSGHVAVSDGRLGSLVHLVRGNEPPSPFAFVRVRCGAVVEAVEISASAPVHGSCSKCVDAAGT